MVASTLHCGDVNFGFRSLQVLGKDAKAQGSIRDMAFSQC